MNLDVACHVASPIEAGNKHRAYLLAPSFAATAGTLRHSQTSTAVPIASRPGAIAIPIGLLNARKCVLITPPSDRTTTSLPA